MNQTPQWSREEIESLLRFYAESGLDFPLEDEAINRFETLTSVPAAPPETEAPSQPAEPAQPPPAARVPAMPDKDAVVLAQAAAAGAESLDALRQAVETFEGCNLKLTARHTVFEGGRRGAPLMIVSDAPGRDDDAQGEALCGREGQLFDRMLAAIGLSRDDCYLGFAVPWRVPGNGAPSSLQTNICKPFVLRQIALAQPELIVLLGNGAARIMLETNETILQLRGQWRSIAAPKGREIPTIATLQPRYLLDHPAQKRFAWTDLLAIGDRLREERRNGSA